MSLFARFNNRTRSLIFNCTPIETQFAPLAWIQSCKWSKCMHMVLPFQIHTLVLVKNTIFNKSHPMTNKQISHLKKKVHICHFYKIFSALGNWSNFSCSHHFQPQVIPSSFRFITHPIPFKNPLSICIVRCLGSFARCIIACVTYTCTFLDKH